MSDTRKVNTVLLGLGVAVGALGAWFFSKKENRTRAAKTISKARKSGGGLLADLSKTVADAQALNKQKKLDVPLKKKAVAKKK